MPGISGSTVAPNQARFGVARFGATRVGDYQPSLVVVINGVNHARSVRLETLRIQRNYNDQPSVAEFTVRGSSPAPVAGQTVVIALGNATDHTREFGGFITTVAQVQSAFAQEVTYQISAADYTRQLDKRIVVERYIGISATLAVRRLLEDFTDLTSLHVQSGLPAIDDVTLTNVRPSTALTRIAGLVGATWYVDEHGDVHFFIDETDYPAPPTLSQGSSRYWDLDWKTDLSQVRTRVIVEGKRLTVPIGIPSGLNFGTFANVIPLESVDNFGAGATVRYGNEVLTIVQDYPTGVAGAGQNPPGTFVITDVSPGDTQIEVDSVAWHTALFPNLTVFVKIGEQVILHEGSGTGGGPDLLNLIPASGFGSIASPIPAGTPVSPLPHVLVGVGLAQDHPIDDDFVLRVTADDGVAQSALAALEGGDGIHEMIVQDGRLNAAGAAARADAELTPFTEAIPALSFSTRHPSTRSGRTVTVSLAGDTSIAGDFLIREVEVSGFDALAPRGSRSIRKFPIRRATASAVRLTSLIDQLSRGEDGL